jgi:hypothetical protein
MDIKHMMTAMGLLSVSLLGGCSTYQESFDCPVGEGIRCASLSTINKKMDKDEIDLGHAPTSAQVTQTTFGSDFAMDLRG